MSSATERITDHMRDRVAKGEWKPGEQIPILDDLIEEYGVSGMTIRRAQQALKAEGLLRSEHGRGVYVQEAPMAGLAATIEPTLSNLAVLVGWMIDNCIEASEAARAIEKFHHYSDWAYAALNDISYDELEALTTQLHSLAAGIPEDWGLTVTVIDYTVDCPHGTTVYDSEAERLRGRGRTTCPHGCTIDQIDTSNTLSI